MSLRSELERYVEQGIIDTSFHIKLAALYEQENVYSKAIAVYERALKLTPEDRAIRDKYYLALQKAVERFEQYLEKKPDDPDVLYGLASFAASVGYQLKALNALEKAIKQKPLYLEKAKAAPEFKDLRLNQKFQELTNTRVDIGKIDSFVE